MGSISPYNLDPAQYTFPSPLKGWENHAPLSEYGTFPTLYTVGNVNKIIDPKHETERATTVRRKVSSAMLTRNSWHRFRMAAVSTPSYPGSTCTYTSIL